MLTNSWQKELDNSGCVGAILMDLSKAYGYIKHNLLIAKLKEYRLDKFVLSFLPDYLEKHSQSAITRSSLSSAFLQNRCS